MSLSARDVSAALLVVLLLLLLPAVVPDGLALIEDSADEVFCGLRDDIVAEIRVKSDRSPPESPDCCRARDIDCANND